MEKKQWKVKLTDELKRYIALFTQAGIIVSMLGGAVYWVNDTFNFAERYADRIATMASEKVLSQLDPLSLDTYLAHQDSLRAANAHIAEGMLYLLEEGINRQDSILLALEFLDNDLAAMRSKVRANSFKLDTLHTGVSGGFADVVRQYEQDSMRTAYGALQTRWRLEKMMQEIRSDNADMLEELRNNKNKGKRLKWKQYRRPKYDSFPVRPR